jgi:outer membrane biosynthesis protein TonB
MNRDKIYALIFTVIFAAIVLLWLLTDTITLQGANKEWPPKHDSEITLAEEEFVEVIELPQSKVASTNDMAAAEAPKPEVNQSEPAPETGMDLVDKGPVAEAPKPVTTTKPAPVQVKKDKEEKKTKTGATTETPKQEKNETEEVRRKATADTKNAFKNAMGKNNTTSTGKTQGDSGKTTGTSSAVNGSGTGSVGGGWVMPHYAKVPSTSTGSLKLEVKIDRNGKVTSVRFVGGDAPAATDSSVRAACEREVRSKRYTRNDDNAPDESTAYITYTFK